MEFKRKLKKDAFIDITSLVDIVFLLLIFFVVTTTFRESPGLNLDLPETRDAAGVRLRDLEVSVVAAGAAGGAVVYLGEQAISIDELEERLRIEIASREQDRRALVVRADREVRFDTVFRVLDIARRAGALSITFPATFSPEVRDEDE